MQCAVLALFFYSLECFLHTQQLTNTLFHVIDMFLQQIVHFGTSRSRLVSDVGQTANLVLTEAQSATAQNELQPFSVFLVVASIPVAKARGLWQQTNLLVITDGLDRAFTPCRQFPNSHVCLTL